MARHVPVPQGETARRPRTPIAGLPPGGMALPIQHRGYILSLQQQNENTKKTIYKETLTKETCYIFIEHY